MRTSRWLLATTVVLTGGLLTACEQPPPGITAFSGAASVRTEALCWAYGEGSLDDEGCAREILAGDELGEAPELRIRPGNVVGISVDTAVADDGWLLSLGGQQLVPEPITETYYRFTFPQAQLPEQGLGLQIRSGSQSQLTGIWAVRLVND